jgi:hypothetical protein
VLKRATEVLARGPFPSIVVLQWCCSGVAVVLQWCCSGVAVVLQWCCSGVTVLLPWNLETDFGNDLPVAKRWFLPHLAVGLTFSAKGCNERGGERRRNERGDERK